MLRTVNPRESNVIEEVVNTCKACAGEYVALKWNNRLVTTGYCFPCSEKEVERVTVTEDKAIADRRLAKFQELCPPMYFNCDTSKLPLPGTYQKVMAGLRPRRGLILVGASRLGKTRSAYALLKGLYLEMGKSCHAITELQLSHELSKFGKSEATMNLIHRLCNVDYLFIDDLGKSVMTQRVVAELYYIIEERISHFKPLIVTMQMNSDDLREKMSSSSGTDMADAIIKRLLEHCDIVTFEQ